MVYSAGLQFHLFFSFLCFSLLMIALSQPLTSFYFLWVLCSYSFCYSLWFFCYLLLWFFHYLIFFSHFISIFCLYNTLDCSVLTASMSPILKQKPTIPIPIKDPITSDLLSHFLVSSIFIVSRSTRSFSIFITFR